MNTGGFSGGTKLGVLDSVNSTAQQTEAEKQTQ
jgi:hypothetical protein